MIADEKFAVVIDIDIEYECAICYMESLPSEFVGCSVCGNAICKDCRRKLLYTQCPYCRAEYPKTVRERLKLCCTTFRALRAPVIFRSIVAALLLLLIYTALSGVYDIIQNAVKFLSIFI